MSAAHSQRAQDGRPGPGELRAYAARNLRLLQVIEQTLNALSSDCEMLRLIRKDVEKTEQWLIDTIPDRKLDPEGVISEQLKSAAAVAVRLHNHGLVGYEVAKSHPHLDEEDGVADAWTCYVNDAAYLFNAIESLRERIETLDSLREPRSGKTYSDVDDLFAAMGL